jgi:hypothetical protein
MRLILPVVALAFASSARTLTPAMPMAAGAEQPSRYGALAIDRNDGDRYGWAVNYETSQVAEDRVFAECGQGCSVVLRFSDECAAYVVERGNSSLYAWGRAPSLATAQSIALREASARGGRDLVERVWGCSR